MQRKHTYTPTTEQERTAEALRELFTPGVLPRDERRAISTHLNYIARRQGVEIQKERADTYLAILAHTNGVEVGGLEHFRLHTVGEPWMRAKGRPLADDDDTAERLRAFYEYAERWHTHGFQKLITMRLYQLAVEAGIDPRHPVLPLAERHTLYTRVAETGFKNCRNAANRLRDKLTEAEACVRAEQKDRAEAEGEDTQDAAEPKGASRTTNPREPSSARKGVPALPDSTPTWEIFMRDDVPNCGFIKNEVVRADRVSEVKVGDIASTWYLGAKLAYTGRVVAVSPESITLRSDEEEKTFERSRLEWLGKVHPEPIEYDAGLTVAQEKQLKKLRDQLEALGEEDDQIIRCTARYKLEKQIYDIEHPVAPPFDPDEWPDELRVIGEEGSAR